MNTELIAFAAFGDWHEAVPKGYIGVSAGNPKRFFLVKASEYKAGMAIDIKRHAELKNPGVVPDSQLGPENAAAGLGKPKSWGEVIAQFNATDQAPEGGGNYGWKRVIAAFNSGVRQ